MSSKDGYGLTAILGGAITLAILDVILHLTDGELPLIGRLAAAALGGVLLATTWKILRYRQR